MSITTESKTLHVRIEPETLQKVKEAASRDKISANRYIIAAITASLDAERDKQWREGFEAMGKDANGADVEYMLHAASKILGLNNR